MKDKNMKRCHYTGKIINGKKVIIADEQVIKDYLSKMGFIVLKRNYINLAKVSVFLFVLVYVFTAFSSAQFGIHNDELPFLQLPENITIININITNVTQEFDNTNVAYLNNSQVFTEMNNFTDYFTLNTRNLTFLNIGQCVEWDTGFLEPSICHASGGQLNFKAGTYRFTGANFILDSEAGTATFNFETTGTEGNLIYDGSGSKKKWSFGTEALATNESGFNDEGLLIPTQFISSFLPNYNKSSFLSLSTFQPYTKEYNGEYYGDFSKWNITTRDDDIRLNSDVTAGNDLDVDGDTSLYGDFIGSRQSIGEWGETRVTTARYLNYEVYTASSGTINYNASSGGSIRSISLVGDGACSTCITIQNVSAQVRINGAVSLTLNASTVSGANTYALYENAPRYAFNFSKNDIISYYIDYGGDAWATTTDWVGSIEVQYNEK